jgi:hypothetical protein
MTTATGTDGATGPSAFLYRGGAEGYTDYPVLPSGDTA